MPDELKSECFGIEPLEYLWFGSKQIVEACTKIQFNDARRVIGEGFPGIFHRRQRSRGAS
jgi:hypothetical protein